MKDRTEKVRKSRASEIKERDTVLIKNLWKKHKLSPNWLNDTFRVIKAYKKSALIENKDKHRFYRNKAHLKKYNEREMDKQRSLTKDQWQNKDKDNESIYELPIEHEGMATESASAQSSSDTEESNPNLLENAQETNQENEIEVTDSRTPIFIPDETPIQIQRSGPVKNVQIKGHRKKR